MSPRVVLAGYAPPESVHSRGLDRIATLLQDWLGADVEVAVRHNVLDSGRQVHELLDDVENGAVSLCYFSTSYLADRVPALAVLDLPYVFDSLADAHRRLDGELGRTLSELTEAATALLPQGYWDNGFRHLSNRHREIAEPEDCQGLRIRLQPSWAHERFFTELGAQPVPTDLRDGIAMITAGAVDAQENPLANFVTYGVDRVHPHLTLTGHAYGARGLYASSSQLRAWPPSLREALNRAVALAVREQRAAAAAAETALADSLQRSGTRILRLSAANLAKFKKASLPVLAQAGRDVGAELLRLVTD